MKRPRNTALITDRLLLRDFDNDDWKAVHQYASDIRVVCYMPWGPNSEDETMEFISRARSNIGDEGRTEIQMAIVAKETDEIIGAARITIQSMIDKTADIGYVLRHDHWNRGLMTEATGALLDFGFANLGMNRIWALVNPDNVGSIRVLEKIGMRREGLLRQNQFIRGVFQDTYLYAKLRSDNIAGNSMQG